MIRSALALPFSLSFFVAVAVFCAAPALSQSAADHTGHAGHSGHDGHGGNGGGDEILGQPGGSGTAWLPAGTDAHAHAVHAMAGDWMLMLHGDVTGRYVTANANHKNLWPPPSGNTGGNSLYPEKERGGRRFDGPNWAMLSAERALPGDNRLLLRTMLSLDPLTIGREGYPLLFQSGEGLVDRQHAHDLFMELAVLYSHRLNDRNQAFVYLGLPGEPALGPSAFMHRPSAGGNPDAPLAHHSQDATHITYGVATAGWIHRAAHFNLKAEASAFRGREPDNDRWDLETGTLDSYSGRLTVNARSLSLQGSLGRIRDPEPGESGDVTRATASIGHRRTAGRGAWKGEKAATLIWGMNTGHHGTEHSLSREASRTFSRFETWNRWESVQRVGEELDLPAPDDAGRHWVHALTWGAGGTLLRKGGLDFFLGGQATVNPFLPEALEPYYGSWPVSAQVFVKLRPTGASSAAGAGTDPSGHQH